MFKIVTTQDEMLKAYSIRSIVFVEEQHCPYDIDIDGKDFSALHVLGEIDNEPFATGRMRFIGEWVKLERLAIRQAYRGKGYGNRLIEFMINTARENGYNNIKLHAQTQTLDFYIKHGFEPKGDFFFEADIEHQLMVRVEK
ncbi:MAG: GNAT family N-acetyltransferase [Proteobacteria bacterium]|nr:GNAT family N-acetyltransferase [Pseudomonadota bacterium]